jgi:NodT family efflux transporter outer membrane factor (OMF) lipoprotein
MVASTQPHRLQGGSPARALLIGAALIALAGCAAIPHMAAAPKIETPADLATAQSFTGPTQDWPQGRWWDAYNDPQLSALIDEALKNSPTLAQAEARLRSAGAQADVQRAAGLPQISASAKVLESEQSRNLGFPPQFAAFLPKGFKDYGRASLDASYDLDLFGKNRAALAAAVSEAAAARADAAQSRLTLSAAVAQAYGDLARLGAERDAAAQTVSDRRLIGDLVAQRLKNGIDSRAELKQAQAATPTSQAELESLDEQIAIARHKLAALVGAGPDRGLDITMPKPGAVKAFGLPADLAANLIGRRPDIVAARLRVEEAGKKIAVARAGFYPNISLMASIGQEALGLRYFTQQASQIGSIGPAITLPIFEGGRLRATYRGSRADYDAAVAAYDETLVTALQDVADTAASIQSAQRQVAERREALAAGEAGYKVARLRFEGGLSTYVAVLSAEDSVITQRRALADAEARAFTLDIALVRALGGGFAAT